MPIAAVSWIERFYSDLRPTPSRWSACLRIVLAVTLSVILLLVWQIPYLSIAVIFVFIVSRESPSVSLRSGIRIEITLAASVATELGVVALTDNNPVARVLSVVIVSLMAGVFVMATNEPGFAAIWGYIYCTLLATWEKHVPASATVTNSLWLLAATTIAVGCSVAVEYAFNRRDPVKALFEEQRARYRSLSMMFALYAQGAGPEGLRHAVIKVAQFASTGQAEMQRLFNTIVDRDLDPQSLPIGARVRITMLAQLMDDSAAFGFDTVAADNPEIRNRCGRIASACSALLENETPGSDQPTGSPYELTPLDRVEADLHAIGSMPRDFRPSRDKELVALPSKSVPLFIPGALRDPQTWAFGLKISLCVTFCYIFYFSVNWPGIETSVITVLIVGLTNTGASKQHALFRLAGAIIGGLIFGLGSIIFLFPAMDSITSLVILVAAITFAAAWISTGPNFSYLGWQIIFAFYIVTLTDFRAPTELAPARDRLIGVLLALVVMWIVFDRLWPVRTVTAMRRSLASLLHSEAAFLRLELTGRSTQALIRKSHALRHSLSNTMNTLRGMNEAVEYEFGVDRKRHIASSEQILRAGLAAVTLFWNELSELRQAEADLLDDADLMSVRSKLADQLDELGNAVVEKSCGPAEASVGVEIPGLPEIPRCSVYVRDTSKRLRQLQTIVSRLGSLP